MSDGNYRGILCIGDPHLCSWSPGFRKDEYPRVILEKLAWTLDYARHNDLLPVLLGDLFHVPRDNANWLITRLMDLLEGGVLTIIGNHDLSENLLTENDSTQVLLAAGRLRRLDLHPWIGSINGVSVMIGGTNNGQPLPTHIDRASFADPRWVFWLTHHDILFPGCKEGRAFQCDEIPGINLVVNGHIHRHYPDEVRGMTTWCNPGNIARVKRSDANRQHVPGVLRIDVTAGQWTTTRLEIPHKSFEEAFHEMAELEAALTSESRFIAGLQTMQKFKTADGEGLRRLVMDNLSRHDNARVKQEILTLLQEVLENARTENIQHRPEHRSTANAI